MSQQHIQFDPDYSDESAPHSKHYASNTYRQKLAEPSVNLNVSAGQRLALAIVSLSIFAFIFLVWAGLGFAVSGSGVYLYVFVGLSIFVLYSIVAIIINFAFNRRY